MSLITVNNSFGSFFVQLYNRHKNYFIQHSTVFSFHLFIRKPGFDNTLVDCPCLLEYGISLLKIIIALINIYHYLTFAEQHDFLQCRNLMSCFTSYPIFKAHRFQFCQCIIFHQSFSVHGAIDCFIMHHYQMSVFGSFQIDLYHIDSHINAILYTLQ